MQNQFTAVIEKDKDWYIVYCPESRVLTGKGKTPEESKNSLAEAIALILEDKLNVL